MPATPNSVIDPRFCCPNRINITIKKKIFTTEEIFVVNDANDNLMFKVITVNLSLSPEKRLIRDANGRPIVTLLEEHRTRHNTWYVFRGNSTEAKDLVFSVKRSSIFGFDTELNVFLADNITEGVCDYKVKKKWLDDWCWVYAGNTIIAQTEKKFTAGRLIGKHKFMVTVCPNIDHAFIVALIVILDEIKDSRLKSSTGYLNILKESIQ